MKKDELRTVRTLFARQYGLAGRDQLRAAGIDRYAEAGRVAAGEWDRPTGRTVRLVGVPGGPRQDLMACLLDAGHGAVASHRSAAWLWGLLGDPPARHAVLTDVRAPTRRGRFDLHRVAEPPRAVYRFGIACTNPLRTLVDLAGVACAGELDAAVDRAVAARLVTVEAVHAEVARLGGRGRKGVGAMRRSLHRRGLVEAPHPSVLESRFARLLRSGGITPLRVEVVAGDRGQYRIDSLLAPRVAAEVDGHAYHSTPEQKRRDEHRRAEIRLAGVFLMVFDWTEVVRDGRRVLACCHQALARHRAVPD